MAFISWTAEKTRLENAIAALDLTVQSYGADGDTVSFRNLAELRAHYGWVCQMAAQESGTGYGRTVAGNGGGRW
ncbi:MAG: hypothetical protein AB7E51_06835 [Pseudodesulfovibrio sp.]|uniref:hypothetical protein n=1 Tax=Pseudodesulfovibrio sp. TaxID=2035812 RepID=UPI003D0FFA1D